MATKYWLGTGAWDTGANWDGGVKPAASDDAVFDSAAAGNLTAGPAVLISMTSIRVTGKYRGSWGASGSPITKLSMTTFVYRGAGKECWFHPTNIGRCTLAPYSAEANAMVFGGASTALGNTYCSSGHITFVAGTTMGAGILETGVDGAGGGESPPEVILPAGLTWQNDSRIVCGAGRIQIYSAPTSLADESVNCVGGEIWHRGGQIDRVFLYAGVYRHDAGAITFVRQSGGYWNSRQSSEARVVTNMIICNGHSVADFRNDAAQGVPSTLLLRFGSPEVHLPEAT